MTDWASPDAAGDIPRAGPPVAPSRGTEPNRRSAGGPPPGPRTPTELIDHAFAFLRRHPRDVITSSALFVIPFAVVVAFLQRNVLGGQSFVDVLGSSDPSLFADEQSGSDATLQLVAFVGPSVGLVFVAAALARLVVAERAGTEVDAGAAFIHALKLSPALLISWLLVHVAELIGVIGAFIGSAVVAAFFTVVAPAIAVERLGPVKGMRRSFTLTKRRFFPVVGVMMMSFFVELMVANALSLLPTAIAAVIGFDVGWIVLGVGTAFVSLITTPFVALVSVELYLDLRVRTEALDIEMRIPELFERA